MVDQIHRFPVVLEPEAEGGFTVRVPSLPEIVTYGADEKEALLKAKDAIHLVVEDCIARGEPIPVPHFSCFPENRLFGYRCKLSVKGLRVRRVLEAVSNERIAVFDLPVQIEGVRAGLEKLNYFLFDAIREALRRRNEIDAMRAFGAGFLAPFRKVQGPHLRASDLTFIPNCSCFVLISQGGRAVRNSA